jgi:hypothetical protein
MHPVLHGQEAARQPAPMRPSSKLSEHKKVAQARWRSSMSSGRSVYAASTLSSAYSQDGTRSNSGSNTRP